MPSDATPRPDSTRHAGTVRFQDGIGIRLATADAFGEPIEQLQLCGDLAALESAVRERVSRLINFRHVRYVRLRGCERLTTPDKDVVIAYDAVQGARVAELLDFATHTASMKIDIDAALQIVRELLPAIAVLHDSRNVTHGAIGPERLVVTPQGRLVIVDHGLGLALGKLGFSRRRLWQQLRVPVPQATGKVLFDARTDVIQIGMVALALVLGRPIGESEFPQSLEKLLDGAKEQATTGTARPLSSELRAWLDRALPLERRVAFMTVREAQQEFEKLFSTKRYASNATALKTLVARYQEGMGQNQSQSQGQSQSRQPASSPSSPSSAAVSSGASSSSVADARASVTAGIDVSAAHTRAQAHAQSKAEAPAQSQAEAEARMPAQAEARADLRVVPPPIDEPAYQFPLEPRSARGADARPSDPPLRMPAPSEETEIAIAPFADAVTPQPKMRTRPRRVLVTPIDDSIPREELMRHAKSVPPPSARPSLPGLTIAPIAPAPPRVPASSSAPSTPPSLVDSIVIVRDPKLAHVGIGAEALDLDLKPAPQVSEPAAAKPSAKAPAVGSPIVKPRENASVTKTKAPESRTPDAKPQVRAEINGAAANTKVADGKGADTKDADAGGAAARSTDTKGADSRGTGSKGTDSRSSASGGSDRRGTDRRGIDSTAADSSAADADGVAFVQVAAKPPAIRTAAVEVPPAEVAAFEQVAADTYSDAQFALATKASASASEHRGGSKRGNGAALSDVDTQAILLMTAVDDETPLLPAVVLEPPPDLGVLDLLVEIETSPTSAASAATTPAAQAPAAPASAAPLPAGAPPAAAANGSAPSASALTPSATPAAAPVSVKAVEPTKTSTPKAPAPKAPAPKPVPPPTSMSPVESAPTLAAPSTAQPAVRTTAQPAALTTARPEAPTTERSAAPTTAKPAAGTPTKSVAPPMTVTPAAPTTAESAAPPVTAKPVTPAAARPAAPEPPPMATKVPVPVPVATPAAPPAASAAPVIPAAPVLTAPEAPAAPGTTPSAVVAVPVSKVVVPAAPPASIVSPANESAQASIVAAPATESHATPGLEIAAAPMLEIEAAPVIDAEAAPVIEIAPIPTIEIAPVPVTESAATSVSEIEEAHGSPARPEIGAPSAPPPAKTSFVSKLWALAPRPRSKAVPVPQPPVAAPAASTAPMVDRQLVPAAFDTTALDTTALHTTSLVPTALAPTASVPTASAPTTPATTAPAPTVPAPVVPAQVAPATSVVPPISVTPPVPVAPAVPVAHAVPMAPTSAARTTTEATTEVTTATTAAIGSIATETSLNAALSQDAILFVVADTPEGPPATSSTMASPITAVPEPVVVAHATEASPSVSTTSATAAHAALATQVLGGTTEAITATTAAAFVAAAPVIDAPAVAALARTVIETPTVATLVPPALDVQVVGALAPSAVETPAVVVAPVVAKTDVKPAPTTRKSKKSREAAREVPREVVTFDWQSEVSAEEAIPAWARGRSSEGLDAITEPKSDAASTTASATVSATACAPPDASSAVPPSSASLDASTSASASVSASVPATAASTVSVAPSGAGAPVGTGMSIEPATALDAGRPGAAAVPFISVPMPVVARPDADASTRAARGSRMLLHAGAGFLGAAAAADDDTDTLDHADGDRSDATDVSSSPTRTRRAFPRMRINWRRTLAASFVVAALEGVAFATAYWYVTPTETGSLLIETSPPGIEVLVDGRMAGRTPYSDSLVPGRHTIELRQGTASRVIPVEISAGVQTLQRITWSKGLKTGQARVTATAPNAHVTIDGRKLGKAPVTVSTLAAGKHMVHVESDSGTVTTPIAVSPGETTELDVPVYPGWVSVLSSVELFIFEGERFLGTTEGEKLLLSPGAHTLTFASETLGYRRTLTVTVVPGATAAVSLPMPRVPVTIEGADGATLTVDGQPAGKLPLPELTVPLGTRDFLFKHPEFGERRQVVTATLLAPVRVVVSR